VGVESLAEYLDLEIDSGFGADRVRDHFNRVLPEGLEVVGTRSIPLNSPSLSVIMDRVRYRVTLPEGVVADLGQLAAGFLAKESHPFTRSKKNGVQEYDLRHELHVLETDANSLTMEIGRGKPLEFAAAVTGLEPEKLQGCRIEKLEVIFKDLSFYI